MSESKIIIDYKDNLPVFDETQLCFDPNERLFIRNSWQTDLIPRYGNSKEVNNQMDFFLKKMTEFLEEAFANCSLKKEEINLIVPHQASRILSVFMKKLGFKKEEYIDIVKDYGNMVSGSVPFALCIALDQNLIKRGDNVALIGTAAGMSINFTLLKY